jgi:hypothetical protein
MLPSVAHSSRFSNCALRTRVQKARLLQTAEGLTIDNLTSAVGRPSAFARTNLVMRSDVCGTVLARVVVQLVARSANALADAFAASVLRHHRQLALQVSDFGLIRLLLSVDLCNCRFNALDELFAFRRSKLIDDRTDSRRVGAVDCLGSQTVKVVDDSVDISHDDVVDENYEKLFLKSVVLRIRYLRFLLRPLVQRKNRSYFRRTAGVQANISANCVQK